MYERKDLPWRTLERKVFKLQKRIYQATRRGNVKAVHRLQRLLTKSWSTKCLAVRRVTQDNQGKRSAGVELTYGDDFINRWSLVPADIVAGQNLITILTSMFMHAGWEHILGNMVFFWAFAPAIEDVMGSERFTTFYLLGGVAATFAQIIVDPTSTVPNLGASGAIASVLGVVLITYPHDQIKTVLFIGWFGAVRLIPAILLVGMWFLTQVFSEVGALASAQSDGVASWPTSAGSYSA